MAPHSSTLAWQIPWMEEPGGLQSMGSWRVGHDWATSLSLFTFMHWRRKWQPTPVFLPGESQGRGTWWAAVCGVAQSRTRLKRLSSSSSKHPNRHVTKVPVGEEVKKLFFQLCNIAIIEYYVSLRCAMCWFCTLTIFKIITTIALANTFITAHSYHFFFVVRTFQIYSLLFLFSC